MIVVDGKAIAKRVLDRIQTDLKGSRSGASPTPGELCRRISIAAVWAGNNMAIGRFVEMKKKAAESVGINMDIYHLASEDAIASKLKELAGDKNVTGIIVELPLPTDYDRVGLLKLIPQEKDIDVLNGSALPPPAVGALKTLFEEYEVEPKGKTAAVFGQSILVGGPISNWLENMGARVFRIDENTENPKELCLQADIVVSGVGKPSLITGDMVKDGAVVVDFGFVQIFPNLKDLRKTEDPRFANRALREANREKIKIVGDVDFDSVAPKSSLITPVPGGMGPLVIASFLENALKLYLSSAR